VANLIALNGAKSWIGLITDAWMVAKKQKMLDWTLVRLGRYKLRGLE
jgi:hypothetical protein